MEDKNAEARKQAQAQLRSIKEMVAALACDYDRLEELRDEKAGLVAEADDTDNPEAQKALSDWMEENQEELDELAEAAGDCKDAEEARERIDEDPLSVQVRSDWRNVGETAEDTEFEILLCTGGPAVKIVGELGQFNEPERARIMFQDWFTSWEELVTTGDDNEALLEYCRCFYFGE